jgi:hypothetical protein
VKLAQAGFRVTIACQPSYARVIRQTELLMKVLWRQNLQCRIQLTLFSVDEARMNELNSGNEYVVTVIPLIFLTLSVDLCLCLM